MYISKTSCKKIKHSPCLPFILCNLVSNALRYTDEWQQFFQYFSVFLSKYDIVIPNPFSSLFGPKNPNGQWIKVSWPLFSRPHQVSSFLIDSDNGDSEYPAREYFFHDWQSQHSMHVAKKWKLIVWKKLYNKILMVPGVIFERLINHL